MNNSSNVPLQTRSASEKPPTKKRRTRRTVVATLTVGMTFILAACGSTSTSSASSNKTFRKSASLTTVDFGSVGSTTDAGVILAQKLGYFRANGLNVVFHKITNAPAITSAVISGQLQVAGIAQSPALFRAFSEHLGIKLVGDKQSISPYLSATHLVVGRQYLGATLQQTLKNLAGKTVAVPSLVDNTDYELERLLNMEGLPFSSVHREAIPFPDMVGALSSGSLAGAVILEPFLTEALNTGTVVNASGFRRLAPGKTTSLVQLVYSKGFLSDGTAPQRFMDAYMKAVRVYDDAFLAGKNRPAVIADLAAAPEVGLPVSTVGKLYIAGLDPDQGAEPGALAADEQFLNGLEHFWMSQGNLSAFVQPSSMWDLTYARNADAKLRPYQYPHLSAVSAPFGIRADTNLGS